MKKLCILLAFVANTVYAQTTVTISAMADNTVYENPSGNSNAAGQNIFSGTNGQGSPRRGLLKFDLSVIPANAIITSATVTLNCNLSRATPDNVSLHKVLAAWGEGSSNAGSTSDGNGATATTNDATWTTKFFPSTTWAVPGGDYNGTASASISINSTGFYQWSTTAMVADVQSWLAMPATNFGWLLICNESAASTARKFGSKENATVANRPSLSVTYTTMLPVTLSYFKAVAKNKSVVLTWETTQEINTAFFEILHSRDGLTFSSLGRLHGNGTSILKHQYSFIHQLNATGSHFYKLSQVDSDGSRKSYSVASVTVSFSEASAVYPNPVIDNLNFFLSNHLNKATYEIINNNGTVLMTGKYNSSYISTLGLPPGTYYFLLYENGSIVSKAAFIKQ